MIWGYQNGWFPEYLTEDANVIWAKLKFLAKYELHDTAIELDELIALPENELRRIGEYLAEHDLHIEPQIWYDYVQASDSQAAEEQTRIIRSLERITPLLRSVAVFTKAGCGQRFDQMPTLAEKMTRLSKRLAPLAAACHDMGKPLGINNQGDFYISDFVELCDQTKDLKLWIDTANIYWAGEPLFPAFDLAAPYTIATHWRDEFVRLGNVKPRGVMLENIVMGQGSVDLARCYDSLCKNAPDPDHLLMEIEMFPQKKMSKIEALDQTLEFCRKLTGGTL
jgi:sugar phosphate isomerase/epimerase